MDTTKSNGVNDDFTALAWSRKFGEWFDSLMTAHGYTNADLARRTDITRVMVGKYRRGMARPSPKTAQKIADAFGLNPFDVMSVAGYGGDVDDTRSRIADLVRFIPAERLPETERYLRFIANEED